MQPYPSWTTLVSSQHKLDAPASELLTTKTTRWRFELVHQRKPRSKWRFPASVIRNAGLAFLLASAVPVAAQDLPNIVIIYCDDLGYGDLSCYNPKAAYRTPRLDKMAKEGIRFTDAHSPVNHLFSLAIRALLGTTGLQNGQRSPRL